MGLANGRPLHPQPTMDAHPSDPPKLALWGVELAKFATEPDSSTTPCFRRSIIVFQISWGNMIDGLHHLLYIPIVFECPRAPGILPLRLCVGVGELINQELVFLEFLLHVAPVSSIPCSLLPWLPEAGWDQVKSCGHRNGTVMNFKLFSTKLNERAVLVLLGMLFGWEGRVWVS